MKEEIFSPHIFQMYTIEQLMALEYKPFVSLDKIFGDL